ncbi:MAG TPA: hypothetical protein VHR66_10195, partial [Gemmataceae bacterium]|jgi:hypothetical protein|nr:hypothetical protein [Gemmataceae bacterium]
MSESSLLELVVLCSTAGGLIVLGLCRLFLSYRSLSIQLSATLVTSLLSIGGPLVAGYTTAALIPGAVVGLFGLMLAVAGRIESTTTTLIAVFRHLGRPEIQATVLAVIGGTLLIGSIARFEQNDIDSFDRDLQFMEQVTWKPPLTPATSGQATTDAGRNIPLWDASLVRSTKEVNEVELHALTDLGFAQRMIRTGPASEITNCHGWVFAASKYWVAPDDVDQLLLDNKYVSVSEPRPGDLVIYRQGNNILHSAVVRTLMDNGPVLVESKWGWMGTFIHSVTGSCYGQIFTYYRSPRQGHTLAGLNDNSKPQNVVVKPN